MGDGSLAYKTVKKMYAGDSQVVQQNQSLLMVQLSMAWTPGEHN